MHHHYRVEYLDDIVGSYVETTLGEKIGTIEAIMLDKFHGKIAYLILAFCGSLARDNQLFALPWRLFSYSYKRERFKVLVEKKILAESPSFNKTDWPDMSKPEWIKSIHEFYGTSMHTMHHS